MTLTLVVCAVLGGLVGWFAPTISQRVCGVSVRVSPVWTALVTALVCGLTAWAVGPGWAIPAFFWIAAVGTVLGFIDIEHHRLPDRLTLPSYPIVAGMLLLPAIIDGDWSAYLRAVLGALVMFVLYFCLALVYPAGMGLGDVKLAGVLGLGLGFIGWAAVTVGFLAAFCLGSVISIGLILARRATRKTAIPFGPFMLAGALVGLLFANDIADWYLSRAIG